MRGSANRLAMRGPGPTTSAGLIEGQYWLPPYIYPPAEFEPIETGSVYIPIPAIGDVATIIQIQIPEGHNGIITHMANNYVGAGFTEGSGQIVWQIARDGAAVDGYDYASVLGSLGSPANPTRHPSGFRVFESQKITLSVKNVSIVVAGQLTGGRLMGWYYPKEYENPSLQTM